jgi:hypothetical protein
MKRMSAFVLCVALAAGAYAAPAFSVSAGAGEYAQFAFSGIVQKEVPTSDTRYKDGFIGKITQDHSNFSLGGYLFFDITYVEVGLSFFAGAHTIKTGIPYPPYPTDPASTDPYAVGGSVGDNGTIHTSDIYDTFVTTGIGISVLAKYPFQMEKFILYPLGGFEFLRLIPLIVNGNGTAATGYGTNYGTEVAKFNSLWIRLGCGLDYTLTSQVYLRAQVLYGIRFENDYETGEKERIADTTVTLGNGPEFRIGIGHNF